MADPLSVTSALVGLITVGCQASKALRDTIQSYKNHPKNVRELGDELKALEDVLQLLEKTSLISGDGDFAALESPLRRCSSACKEFEQALLKCSGRNEGDRSNFMGWLKIRWMGSDINGFKDTLAGYKSTITIAIAGVNLRKTKASLDVIQEYKDMIQSTTTDLKEHLYTIDEKLRSSAQEQHSREDPIGETAMRAERASTMKCLEICAQVSNFINERQTLLETQISGPTASTRPAEFGTKSASSRQIVDESLQGCESRIKSANAQLMNRLHYLSNRLSSMTSNPVQASSSEPSEQEQMAEEIGSIQQCLEICDNAAEEAEKARINVMEDVTTAEDSRQILVSTIGDLIAAHRVTAGARSLQCIGQMSDETLQQISRSHGLPFQDHAQAATESGQARGGVGRTLGSSNVRTF